MSTLTLTIGMDGGNVGVIVGVDGMVVGVTVGKLAVESCPTRVRAREVSVASISKVGAGVTEGKLHANAMIIMIPKRKTMPLCFFKTTS